MENPAKAKAWHSVIQYPLPGHCSKPRATGLTMIIDKGLGLYQTQDLLEIAGDFVDFVKLGFGTSAFYDEVILRKKIALVKSSDIDIYPGGTFFEVAWLQNRVKDFFHYCAKIGFTAIEISDGTINLTQEVRQSVIRSAKRFGFKVLTEVGKKNPDDSPSLKDLILGLQDDLDSEADVVIVEGRESGKGIGIYDQNGSIKKNEFATIAANTHNLNKLMWEAPLKNQQHELISAFGPNVNLGNISPNDCLSLECLRTGMRGDTLREVITSKEYKKCALT